MNRLQFLARATTVYGIHSPLLFELSTEVLGARLPRAVRRRLGSRQRCLVYKLCRHYGATFSVEGSGLVRIAGPWPMLVVWQPHRSADAERQWQQLAGAAGWRVALDCWHYGLLLADPRLHPQHILLKV